MINHYHKSLLSHRLESPSFETEEIGELSSGKRKDKDNNMIFVDLEIRELSIVGTTKEKNNDSKGPH